MDSNTKHTPLPWDAAQIGNKRKSDAWRILGPSRLPIDDVANVLAGQGAERAKEHAAFIVETVNSHAQLKAALQRLCDRMNHEVVSKECYAITQEARALLGEKM